MRAPYTDTASECISSARGREQFISDRPTCASIDLTALSHNFTETAQRAEGRKIIAVVKAQAYGHGAVPVSHHLITLGADMLGVALIEEGRQLREAGINSPVLVMGALFPEQAEAIAAFRLTPVVSTLSFAQALSAAADKLKTTVPIHVKIDTGMGRIGIQPEEAPDLIVAMRKLAGIDVQGLMTHFADADLRDKEFAAKQIDSFEAMLRNSVREELRSRCATLQTAQRSSIFNVRSLPQSGRG